MHVALRFAYDGTQFASYARQPAGGTVEDALIEALRGDGYVEGSWRTGSRTDAGVSALANVAACRLDRAHLTGLIPATQALLPAGLWLTGVAAADPHWHPRHAQWRTYQYFALRQGEDPTALQAACRAFIGEHDFSAFARLEGRQPVRPVTAMRVSGLDPFWRFEVRAPGFLWNQVRRMVAACLAVGQGRATVRDIDASLASGRGHGAFGLAAAPGLVLASVRYRPAVQWAASAGRVPAGRVRSALQAAEVRRRVVQSLGG